MVRETHLRLVGFAVAAALLLGAFARGATLEVLAPANAVLSANQEVDLGAVGPGQSIEILIANATGEESGLKAGAQADWDQLNIIEPSLPNGWKARNGLIYEKPFRAFVIVSPEAKDGTYTLMMQAVDEYEGLKPLTVKARVRVDRSNVFALSLKPPRATVAVGTPAYYSLTLENLASASDIYNVTLAGFPGAANYSKIVFVPRRQKVTVPFEMVSNEQAQYSVSFTAVSLSSYKVNATATSYVESKASLLEDMQSAGYGILLFPHSEQVVIGLLAFFANVLGG